MINEWLDTFKVGWTTKDIERVLSLFTDDVEYWETPYQRVENKKALRQEWNAILKQKDIRLDLRVFSSFEEKHTILWELSYERESLVQEWAGIYLIELDETGKCSYFYQTGEKR